jgi:hypothetical protein
MYHLHSIMGFGKHKKRPVWVVAVCDSAYLDWCIKNVEDFCIEDINSLETLPRTYSKDLELSTQLKELVKARPDIYQPKYNEPQSIEDYFTEKGYSSYLENFKPFMCNPYKFSKETIELNSKKCSKARLDEMRLDSRNSAEKYDFDDMINDAFEGDYSNYSNID